MPPNSLKTTIRQEINRALDRFATKYLAPAFADIQNQFNQTATKQDLKQFPTRKEVKQAFDQVGKTLNQHSKILNLHSQDLGNIKTDMLEVRRRLSDLERDIPSQEEFNQLKARVDRYHPVN